MNNESFVSQISELIYSEEKRIQKILYDGIVKSNRNTKQNQELINTLIDQCVIRCSKEAEEITPIWVKDNECELSIGGKFRKYSFGHQGGFDTFTCSHGYENMFSDIMFSIVSNHYKL